MKKATQAQLIASLAVFATTDVSPSRKGIGELTLDECRAACKISDTRKKVVLGEPAKLAIKLGKKVISLDGIGKNATRLTVPLDKVDEVTKQLQQMIDHNFLDDAILAAQKAQAKKYNQPIVEQPVEPAVKALEPKPEVVKAEVKKPVKTPVRKPRAKAKAKATA